MSTLFHTAKMAHHDHVPMDRGLLQEIVYSVAQAILPLLIAAVAVFALA